MQTAIDIFNFLAAHKADLVIVIGLAAIYWLIQGWAWLAYGPKDVTGNGITIGRAKAFDNRSLALRIERLSNRLASLNVVNPNFTDNVGTVQQQSSSQTGRALTLEVKAELPKATGAAGEKSGSADKDANAAASSGADVAKSDGNPAVALAAGDVLNDQLNLASQILNLETLYERSLTDRLINGQARLQTVLGFQVSLTPPRGCENCVAVVEIGVRMIPQATAREQASAAKDYRVSLVALIPHEKTYNAQTLSTSSRSIGGSAVASVMSLGFSSKGESRQLFIHRDSDTIAFERDPRNQPTLFGNDSSSTVFGWEFRPVLGRSTVSPGTRQMLAVIAMPTEELAEKSEVTLEIASRSYWRRFNRRKQTSRRRWNVLPWNIDKSMRNDFPTHELVVPNTARIQDGLEPKVTGITWVNSGAVRANVIIRGSNFFSGTKVLIGGRVLGEENGGLALKSNQALEFETDLSSLGTGDCVLSGRFGLSKPLRVVLPERICALAIVNATIEPGPYNNAAYLTIDVKAIDRDGEDIALEVADIQKLPEPILFVGAEPVAMPYDYFDKDPPEPSKPKTSEATAAAAGAQEGGGEKKIQGASEIIVAEPAIATSVTPEDESDSPEKGTTSAAIHPSKEKYVRVGVWIPRTLAASPTVSFRVPFCGLEYQSSLPLVYSEPSVTLIGSDDESCTFRIVSPAGFRKPFTVELDRIYDEKSPELEQTSSSDYRFTVPIKLAAQYPNLVIRTASAEPYLRPITVEMKRTPKTTIETTGKPSQIEKGRAGPIEWSGTTLNAIESVTVTPPPGPAEEGSRTVALVSPDPLPVQFAPYDHGKKIEVYFTSQCTKELGKACVKFTIKETNEPICVPVFIIEKN